MANPTVTINGFRIESLENLTHKGLKQTLNRFGAQFTTAKWFADPETNQLSVEYDDDRALAILEQAVNRPNLIVYDGEEVL